MKSPCYVEAARERRGAEFVCTTEVLASEGRA
jgi:hypothetical protein